MIVEGSRHVTGTCARCRGVDLRCVEFDLYESDRGQHVYSIRMDLRLLLCLGCLAKAAQPPPTYARTRFDPDPGAT